MLANCTTLSEEKVSASLATQARSFVRQFPECFWFRHPDAEITSFEDVHLIIRRLREHGDQRTWLAAQELLSLCP